MKELDFRNWLNKNNVSKKMQSDFISRIKQIEIKLSNIDYEYAKDKCSKLLEYFSSGCKNPTYTNSFEFKNTSTQYSVLKYAIKKYCSFLESEFN